MYIWNIGNVIKNSEKISESSHSKIITSKYTLLKRYLLFVEITKKIVSIICY